MQLIIVMMLQKFRFKVTAGFEPEMHPMITLRMLHGMRVDVEMRKAG
jgi:hypothetical protein